MAKTQQKLTILMVIVCLALGFWAKIPGISWAEINQPTATLIPYAYLPLVSNPAPFVKSENSPFYLQNFANNAGCDWMGVAGEVLDLNKSPS